MRPQSIIRFEQLYLAGTAVGVVNLMVNYGVMTERAGSEGGVVLLAGAALGWITVFLFWYFITRRASHVAKWLLVVLTVPGLLGMSQIGVELAVYGALYIVLALLTMLLQLAAIAFLFRRDAADWLRSKGQQEPIDVTTFN